MDAEFPTVLFVEDSDLDFELASCAIKRLERPMDVVRVASRQHLQQYVAGSPVLPALVVMDLRLPDASGIDIAREIREHGMFPSGTPVVIFSTSDAAADLDAARRLGLDGFEVKPLDASRYVEIVQQIVQRWVAPPGPDGLRK